MDKKEKVALYIRVSTHHQVDKDSLPFQRRELINYAKYALDIDDYVIFEDAGYSGKNTDRPQFQDMMFRIRQREFSHLLVWKIDRISRNLLDFTNMYEELKEYSCTFVSKNEQFDTSSAMGEAMLKIILIFAELERKLTAERVYSIMLSRAEKGLWNGAPTPLGYDYDANIKYPVPNEEEAEVVKFIFKKYLELKSTTDVKQALEQKGYKTKRDGNWTTKVISDIIQNPFYIGTYRYNYRYTPHGKIRPESEWIIKENNHEGIVDKELFHKCQEILNLNASHKVSRRRKHTHIFGGILHCPTCNRNYSASLDRVRKDGYAPSQYKCYNYVNSKKDNRLCKNIVGDVTIGQFIFSYIFNLVNAIEYIKKNPRASNNDIEKILLRGEEFDNVAGIVTDDLEDIVSVVLKKSDEETTLKIKNKSNKVNNKLLKRKATLLRAIDRLDNLYLFSDESMSEKDYLLKKQQIEFELKDINTKISNSKKEIENIYLNDMNFIEKATKYLILSNVLNRKVGFNDMIKVADKKIIKTYVDSIIRRICVDDKKILSIEFTNSMIHRFIYR